MGAKRMKTNGWEIGVYTISRKLDECYWAKPGDGELECLYRGCTEGYVYGMVNGVKNY